MTTTSTSEPGAQLAIVVMDGLFIDTGRFACTLLALVPDVVDGDSLHVATFFVALHDAPDVRVHTATTADEADVDAIVRTDDATACRGLSLARRSERLPSADCAGRGHRASGHLLHEIAPRGLIGFRHGVPSTATRGE